MTKLTRRAFLAMLPLIPELAYPAVENCPRQKSQIYACTGQPWFHLTNKVIGPCMSVVEIGKASFETPLAGELSAWTNQFIRRFISAADSSDRSQSVALRHEYRQHVREDFQYDRICLVKGYFLSQSEVEICQWLASQWLASMDAA